MTYTGSGYYNVFTASGNVPGVWGRSKADAMAKVPGATGAESVL